jgi:hypothetical protein
MYKLRPISRESAGVMLGELSTWVSNAESDQLGGGRALVLFCA